MKNIFLSKVLGAAIILGLLGSATGAMAQDSYMHRGDHRGMMQGYNGEQHRDGNNHMRGYGHMSNRGEQDGYQNQQGMGEKNFHRKGGRMHGWRSNRGDNMHSKNHGWMRDSNNSDREFNRDRHMRSGMQQE